MTHAVRLPKGRSKLVEAWIALPDDRARGLFLSEAIRKNRFDVFAAACHAPAPVGALVGGQPYEKLAYAIAKHDAVELLDALDCIDPRLGQQVRTIGKGPPLRELASRAVASRALGVLVRLLDEGLDPRELDPAFGTSLSHMMACVNWLDGFAEVQRRFGSQLESRDKRGRTLLHAAVRHGQVEFARELLAQGADLHAKDDKGRNVFFACLMGHLESLNVDRPMRWKELAILLIEHGADLDAPTGKTTRSNSLRDYIRQREPDFLSHVEPLFDWVRSAKALEDSTPPAPVSSAPRRM